MQSTLVGIEGGLILACQPGAIAKQEPGVGVVGLMLGQALSVIRGRGIVALLESIGGGARIADAFDAASIAAETS